MMKYSYSIFLVLILTSIKGWAQNIVPNPSFEEYTQCPDDVDQLNRCKYWYNPTSGSPDYFNSCETTGDLGVPKNRFGYQQAIGNAYIGIRVFTGDNHFREYIAIDIPALQKGIVYEVSLSISLVDMGYQATNNFGVFFFDKTIISSIIDTGLNVIPQISYKNYGAIADTANWTKLTAIFTADSAYSHIIIGGFGDEATIMKENHLTINDASYYYVDSVLVRATSIPAKVKEANELRSVSTFPNPVIDKLTIEKAMGIQAALYDVMGRILYFQKIETDDVAINVSGLSPGVYTLRLSDQQCNQVTKKILKE